MRISHPDGHDVTIAGTHYQKTNTRAVYAALGGKPEGRGEVSGWATLLPEPSNPYDEHAVLVLVEGKKVGYIPAPEAPMYGKWIREQGGKVEVPVRLSQHSKVSAIKGQVYLPSFHRLSPTRKPVVKKPPAPPQRSKLPPLPEVPSQSPPPRQAQSDSGDGCIKVATYVVVAVVVILLYLAIF